MQRAEGRGHRARGSGEGHLGSLEQPYKVVHIGCQAHLWAKGTCTVRCVLCSCVWLQAQPSLRGESIGWVLYSLINTVLYLSLHIGPVPPLSHRVTSQVSIGISVPATVAVGPSRQSFLGIPSWHICQHQLWAQGPYRQSRPCNYQSEAWEPSGGHSAPLHKLQTRQVSEPKVKERSQGQCLQLPGQPYPPSTHTAHSHLQEAGHSESPEGKREKTKHTDDLARPGMEPAKNRSASGGFSETEHPGHALGSHVAGSRGPLCPYLIAGAPCDWDPIQELPWPELGPLNRKLSQVE